SAAATPISRVRQQRVPTPFRGTPLREDAEAWCPVCLDDLAAKRVMTLQPCRHVLHRTCGLLWLETREDWTSASCPMCRTRVRGMKDHKGAAMTPVIPLGSTGQPTWGYACTPFTINQLLRSTELRLEECTQQESAAAAAGDCGPEYMRDFAEEKERLAERTRILEQLRERVVNGEDADDGAPQVDLQRARRLLEMLQTQEEQLRQMQQTRDRLLQERQAAQQVQSRPVLPMQQTQQRPQPAAAPSILHQGLMLYLQHAQERQVQQAPPVEAVRRQVEARGFAQPTASSIHRRLATEQQVQQRRAAVAARAARAAAVAAPVSQFAPPTVGRSPAAARPTASSRIRAAAVANAAAAAATTWAPRALHRTLEEELARALTLGGGAHEPAAGGVGRAAFETARAADAAADESQLDDSVFDVSVLTPPVRARIGRSDDAPMLGPIA
ncbi:hypothetical protein PFISCL1PPCAC_26073, partial [Pristionchus fissidentatus]